MPPCAEAPHTHAPRRRPPAPAEAVERAAAIFRAAGDVARLRLLERLGEGECCVTELAAEASEPLSTVSQRLRVLRAEGLVSRRREGKHIYYALADGHVAELIHNALAHAHEAPGAPPPDDAPGPDTDRPASTELVPDTDRLSSVDLEPDTERPAPGVA
ncbi:MAG TPA: metalloregulator ArsR/SmtB family transcription factor [Polyangiaceae bacterium]|nr:metalloregulator ArsR/SmtB family transcription factor [Polyangiaceae bacterium]